MNSISQCVATLHEALGADPIQDIGIWDHNLLDALVLAVNGRDEPQQYWRFGHMLGPYEIAVFDDVLTQCIGYESDAEPYEFVTAEGERITAALGLAIAEARRRT